MEGSDDHPEQKAARRNLFHVGLSPLYAAQGEPVLPCHGVINGYCTCGGLRNCKPGKHPLTPPVKDATTDLKTIRGWWERWPYANVAIATGGHLFVLDIDPRHGGDATLAALIAQHGGLPHTPAVATGGGARSLSVIPLASSSVPGAELLRGSTCREILAMCSPRRVSTSATIGMSGLRPSRRPSPTPPDWLLALVINPSPWHADGGGSHAPRWVLRSPATSRLAPWCREGKRNDSSATSSASTSAEATALRRWRRWLWRGLNAVTLRSPNPRYSRQRSAGRNVSGSTGAVSAPVRTSEPTPAIEVDKYVRSLAEASTAPYNPHHCPRLTQTPSSMTRTSAPVSPRSHADAYHGLAGEIVQRVAPETEADPSGILLSLLTAFGNAVGNGPHFAMNAGVHHTNLFNALVGGRLGFRQGADVERHPSPLGSCRSRLG